MVEPIIILALGIFSALILARYISTIILKKIGELRVFNNIVLTTIAVFLLPSLFLKVINNIPGIFFVKGARYIIMIIASLLVGIPLQLNHLQNKRY